MFWIPIAVLVFFAHVILLAVGNAKDANNKRKEDAFKQERDRFIKAVTDERLEEKAKDLAVSMSKEERLRFIGEFAGDSSLHWEYLAFPSMAGPEENKYTDMWGTYILAFMASKGKLPRRGVYDIIYHSCCNTVDGREETDRMAFMMMSKVQSILRARYPELGIELLIQPAGGGPIGYYRFDEYKNKLGTGKLRSEMARTRFTWNKTTMKSLIKSVG